MADQQPQSRYQVRVAAEPAWATDDKGTLYRFDGLRFSRCRRRDDAFTVVPAWQTPSYGWLGPSACPLPAAMSFTTPARPSAGQPPHLAA
jgi:hypothetical protein